MPLVGWHNYYPRPEAGLSEAFYDQQNGLFASRGLALYSFIPGEVSFRAPLFLGLPTLEAHRHRNGYVTYLQTTTRQPAVRVVCAEGVLHDEHLRWITHFEQTGEVTVPLVSVDRAAEYLKGRSWRLRPEGTESSFRIEETRGATVPERIVNADVRARGSLQVDLAGYGRYPGEVHLMRRDRPLSHLEAFVGSI
ncbi:MAG TPA: MupG family TIM beta-alpha barrel fold protein, partial [Propionicimonas sp.]|nr:MupG family TIM beta-alpha barrel fold protein [Propionicimonas sp.]